MFEGGPKSAPAVQSEIIKYPKSLEKFYSFKARYASPGSIRDLIDSAPEDELLDEQFQLHLVEELIENVSANGNSPSEWLSILNGYPARGLEGMFSGAAIAKIEEEITDSIALGHIDHIKRLRNVLRPVAHIDFASLLIRPDFLEAIAQGLVSRSERGSGTWYENLADIRSLDPAFADQNIAEALYKKYTCTFLQRFGASGNIFHHLIKIKEFYPEMIACVVADKEIMNDLVFATYVKDGQGYGPGLSFEAVFGMSVYEVGLEYKVHTLIESTIGQSIDTALAIKTLLGADQFSLEDFIGKIGFKNALAKKLQSASSGEVIPILKKYIEAFNVPGDDLISDERFAYTVANHILVLSREASKRYSPAVDENSDLDITLEKTTIESFSEAMGLSENGKQYFALHVGFKFQKGFAVAKGAEIHKTYDLSYDEPAESKEENYFAHSKYRAMNEGLQGVLEHMYGNIKISEVATISTRRNRIAIKSLSKQIEMDEAVFIDHVLDSMVTSTQTAGLAMCIDIVNAQAEDDFFANIVEAARHKSGFKQKLFAFVSEQYTDRSGDHTYIKILHDAGLITDEDLRNQALRTAATINYFQAVRGGSEGVEIRNLFSLDEHDISLEEIRGATKEGITKKMLGQVDEHCSVDEVRVFAHRMGMDGEYLQQAERSALLAGVKTRSSGFIKYKAKAHGLPETVYIEDKDFYEAALSRVKNDLIIGRVDGAVDFIIDFHLERDIPHLQQTVFEVWRSNPKIIFGLLENRADMPEGVLDHGLATRLITLATSTKEAGMYASAVALNNAFSPLIEPLLSRTESVFGEQADWGDYIALQRLLVEKEIPEEYSDLGVTKVGEEGVMQLREKMVEFQRNIIHDRVTAEELEGSSLKLKYFMDKTRVKVTQWGQTKTEEAVATVHRSQDYLAANPEAHLNEKFTPSETLLVGTVKEQKDFTFDQDFVERYEAIQQSIFNATENCDPLKRPLSRLVSMLEVDRELLIDSLEQKLSEEPSDQLMARAEKDGKRQGVAVGDVLRQLLDRRDEQIQKSLEALRSVNLRSVESVQENFVVLAKYKEFHSNLREFMFTFALLKRAFSGPVNQRDKDFPARMQDVSVQTKGVESISATLDFVDHIVNQEVMDQYFTDKEAANAFRKINSTVALQKQLRKMSEEADGKKLPMKIIPTRGALLEFSGQIADACWASRYDLIAKEFPNFTAATMVSSPDSPAEKMIGSALLIETESDEGEKLLVIRGLNPLQNTINKLDVDDFYEQFTMWAKKQAAKMGRKLAIVIDDHSGGSSTNRPKLFDYLSQKKSELDRVTLKSEEDTNFNGYSVVYNTYLVA